MPTREKAGRVLTAYAAGLLLAACSVVEIPVENPDAENLSLSSLISNNMVLQSGMPCRIWGKATPGGLLRVRLAGQSIMSRVNSDGDWEVLFEPVRAGGPYELVVEGGDVLRLSNVMFGEVWVCSGQSNMQWNVANSAGAQKEIASADYPDIRLFSVPRKVSDKPLDQVEGAWKVCSPGEIAHFSAVAYFFGRKLHTDLKVPVGLIHSSWGGTPAESWTSRGALESEAILQPIIERFDTAMRNYPENFERYQRSLKEYQENVKKGVIRTVHEDPGNTGFEKGFASPEFDDSAWKTMRLPQMWDATMNIDGAVWFRRELKIPAEWAGRELALDFPPIDDFDTTYFNNVQVGATGKETPDFWKTPRSYRVPAELVEDGRAVLAVRVFDHFGAGGFAPGTMNIGPADAASERVGIDGDWKYLVELELNPGSLAADKPPQPPMGPENPHSPSGLFNAMIHPLLRYPVRGAIWYQGESNASRAYQYRTLLKTLVSDWRRAWDNQQLAFMIVQLANFGEPARNPGDSNWAELREAQQMALELPLTGLAVAIDIGEAKDIHPRNKQDVGYRLALAAEHAVYGMDIVHSGPTFDSMQIEGSKIRIRFKNTGSGLIARDGGLRHFAIASEDGPFVWAEAIIEGDSVVVESPEVKSPAAVRYAWADNPEGCNLYNREGLPAVPFRTDSRKGATEDRR